MRILSELQEGLQKTEMRMLESEIHRLKGELLLLDGEHASEAAHPAFQPVAAMVSHDPRDGFGGHLASGVFVSAGLASGAWAAGVAA